MVYRLTQDKSVRAEIVCIVASSILVASFYPLISPSAQARKVQVGTIIIWLNKYTIHMMHRLMCVDENWTHETLERFKPEFPRDRESKTGEGTIWKFYNCRLGPLMNIDQCIGLLGHPTRTSPLQDYSPSGQFPTLTTPHHDGSPKLLDNSPPG